MGLIAIQCPACHVEFRVSDEYANKRARCKGCGQVFVIKVPSMEDSIAEWLIEAEDQEEASSSAQTMIMPSPGGGAGTRRASRPATASSSTAASSTLHLSHTDPLGAFFVFPPSLLADPGFRSSMPRCCLCCGVAHSLTVHLVIWRSKLADRDRAEFKTPDISATILADDLLRMTGPKLVESLPRVPKIPTPFNLPMPYFVCNRCPPAGAVMTHVRPTPDGGEECELGIASLKRAVEFLAANVGRRHQDYHRLAREVEGRKDSAWNSLPLGIRHRLENWYKPVGRERFICYVPDTDYAKAEAGMGGLVVSDRRLVYHKFNTKVEIPLTEKVELQAENTHDHYLLRLGRPGEKPVVLKCDPDATEMVRRALRKVGARYTYRA